VYFRRQIQLDQQNVAVSFTDGITSRSGGYELVGSLSTNAEDFRALRLRGLGNWACNPSFVDTESEIAVIGADPEESVQLSVETYPEQSYSTNIKFPPLSILKAARICANDAPEKLPPQIHRLYSGENEVTKLEAFLEEISAVISYDSYIKIVERLAEISPKFRHHLRQNIEQQLTKMLTGQWNNDEYSIESYDDLNSRIQDFETLGPIKKLSKEIDSQQIIKQGLNETMQSGSIDNVVILIRTLDLFNNHAELLRPNQVDATLATQLINDDFNGAWDLILNCFSLEDNSKSRNYRSVKDDALSAEDYRRKRKLWKESLPLASGNHNLCASIANYLYWTGRTKQYDGRLLVLLYEGAKAGFAQAEITYMRQHSEFNLHFQLGINHRNSNNHKESAAAFNRAYEVETSTDRQRDPPHPRRIVARKNWAISLSNHYRYNGQYEDGIEILEVAIDEFTKLTDSESPDNIEDAITEVQAQVRTLEMEQYLVDSEYELGLETAGNIIKQYSKIGDKSSQKWAITKRKEIQAIIHETNGDLEDAASLHRSIGKSDSISEARKDWHIHRADICQAKQLALDRDFQQAKEQLLRIKKRTNRLESEANDLAVVLEAIIDYQNRVQRHFQDSLNKLSSESEPESRAPPMHLDYNYEDPLAVIHAAQWLRTYDVDTEVLSMSVDVALQASLIPLHDNTDVAEIVGLDDVNLRDQWLMQLPSPIAQRITQIRLDLSVPKTDYSGLGSRLFSLLELHLAIFGEYYGSLKWGKEWRRNLSDANKTSNMALGDLANVFTKCSEQIQCSDAVADLVTGTKADSSVVKLRNDIGHGKTDDVHSDEYQVFQDRVFSIFQESADETPVVGEAIETRGKGGFQIELVHLKWWRTQRRIFVQTNADLRDGTLYYFPQGPIREASENSKIIINADEIVPVETDRISSKFG